MTLICRNTPSYHQLWDSCDWVVQSKQSRAGVLKSPSSLFQVSHANAQRDPGDRNSLRTVKGNQQTAINRGKIHRYPSLGTGMDFITLRGFGRPPSFYSNVDMNLYLLQVCIGISVSTARETWEGGI